MSGPVYPIWFILLIMVILALVSGTILAFFVLGIIWNKWWLSVIMVVLGIIWWFGWIHKLIRGTWS